MGIKSDAPSDGTAPDSRRLNGAGHGSVPIRQAASLMIVRDGERGVEALLGQRGMNTGFFAGAHVFPGGAIDVSDSANSSPRPRAGCVWNSDDLVASIDDLEATSAIAHVVGAIRESLEEAGVAIGLTRLDDSPIDAEQCNLLRVLHGNGNSFVSSLVDMQIGIDGSQLAYAAHWTTPLGASRRYSTRYFVALANESIEPVADGHELVSTDWWTPADAFAAASEGRIGLLLPIQKNLELIAQHDSVDALISATRANKSVPHMAPRIVIDDGVARVLLPGDDGYDQAEFGELPEGAPLPGLPGGPVHD